MKSRLIAVLSAIAVVLIIPTALAFAGFATPPVFAETYYGALSPMYGKLKSAERKKIIIIGTSSVPFGIDSALAERQLNAAGVDYDVVNFGLYGALGSKVMTDLSLNAVGEGDIVVYAPEPHVQCMSLYFSASEFWYAADGDKSLLLGVAKENVSSLTGAFVGYVAEKYRYLGAGKTATASGIYARSSFDGNMDLKNYDRPQNIMAGGADLINRIDLDNLKLDGDYVGYVNGYFAAVRGKGATPLFSFAPMNESAIRTDDLRSSVKSYYDYIAENFDCEILSDPFSCIMEKEWFYDSNFHLNSSGMTVFTAAFIDSIKNYFGVDTPTDVALPEKPALATAPAGVGDNSAEAFFEYEETETGCVITGVKSGVKLSGAVTVPYSHGGKTITSFKAGVFAENAEITEITLQDNVTAIENGSFDGCASLTALYIKQKDPSRISIGHGLTNGADLCYIYVDKDCLSAYTGNYFWRVYANRIRAA